MSTKAEHAELNKQKWDRRSETYDEKRFSFFRFFQQRVISLMPLRESDCVLDIGCGTGWAVRYMAGRLQDGGQAYGVDISDKMIEKAVTASSDLGNVHFQPADAEELPFEGDFFNSIICTNSFHHYKNPVRVLEEINRVLKLEGRVYLMDPTADGFLVRRLDKRFRRKEREHVKFYSSYEYRLLFQKANLRYIRSRLIVPLMKVHIAEK